MLERKKMNKIKQIVPEHLQFSNLFAMWSQKRSSIRVSPQRLKSPMASREVPFFFSIFATVIACRPIPNDKKYTGHVLSISRFNETACAFRCRRAVSPLAVTLKRIVQRPGELILFRCRLTWHLAARWTAIAIFNRKRERNACAT